MSTRSPRAAANARSERSSLQAGNPRNSVGTLPEEDIRRRAYEIYLERGGQPGSALDDWLRAEKELEEWARNENRASR